MNPVRTVWYWGAVVLLTAAVIGYAQKRELYTLHSDYRASEDQVRMLERQYGQSAVTEAQLQRRVDELHDDPLELEAAIRHTKRLVREGETIYRVRVPEPTNDKKAPAVP